MTVADSTTQSQEGVGAALAVFRAGMPVKAPNARSLAATIENPGCIARRVLDAAGVDKLAVATQLGTPTVEEQSVFAVNRGTRFERDVKADGYTELIDLLRTNGFAIDGLRVLPLRDRYPINPRNPDVALRARADETRAAILDMARQLPSAHNLIDGGALAWDFGGAVARLETDGIAWCLGGQIRVIEIKSFPIVDGRGDPEKVGAAAWQAAVYVAAIADLLVAGGFEPSLVSTEVLLVCPRNTSLTPTMARLDVTRRVRSLRRLLAGRTEIGTLLQRLGPDVNLDTRGMDRRNAARHLASTLAALGTNYLPSCLAACPLAFHCREQARAAGEPGCLGTDVRASLGGVVSLSRALELAGGARPEPGEGDATAMLVRARRLVQAVEHRADGARP